MTDPETKAKELLTSRGWHVGWVPRPRVSQFAEPGAEDVWFVAAKGHRRVEARSLGELVQLVEPWGEQSKR